MAVSHDESLQASGVATALVEGGFWPAAAGNLVLPSDVKRVFGRDLIPVLLSGWASVGDLSNGVAAWLADQQQRGAALTLGYDSRFDPAAAGWLGLRLAWWPTGVPEGRRIGLASSRLGRRLDTQQAWLAVLRAACAKIDRRRELFDLPLLCIEAADDDHHDLERWLEAIMQLPAAVDGARRIVLSPPLPGATPADAEVAGCAPVRDRALVTLSDRLLVFHVRSRGRWHQLLHYRLASKSWPLASVYVAVGRQMVSPRCASGLLDAGAVGWVVPATLNIEARAHTVPPKLFPAPVSANVTNLMAMPPEKNWEYLTHWTRRCDGAWPGQQEEEYLDDLILQRDRADRSALAVLRRIVSSQRLLASSYAIRGGTAVVCFTAVPLAELQRRRVFRAHRARWDFEPYGICIRRDWLDRQGARAVHYGNDELWTALPAEEQPFFQARQSRGKGSPIDWTAEEEWRHVGDVLLDQVPADAAFVFVPTSAEAERIAEESPWPIMVVGDVEDAPPPAQIGKPR
jgi:hypothetical protein